MARLAPIRTALFAAALIGPTWCLASQDALPSALNSSALTPQTHASNDPAPAAPRDWNTAVDPIGGAPAVKVVEVDLTPTPDFRGSVYDHPQVGRTSPEGLQILAGPTSHIGIPQGGYEPGLWERFGAVSLDYAGWFMGPLVALVVGASIGAVIVRRRTTGGHTRPSHS